MASTGKKKTTMAKLARESRLRERRMEKQARKVARKDAAAQEPEQLPADFEADGDDVAEAVPAESDQPTPGGEI
jgi:hypothetical protein